MIKNWLPIILAFLTAFQSLSAIADTHQFNQTNSAHLEFDHQHGIHSGIGDISDNASDSETTQAQLDHHGCHCHCLAHLYLSSDNSYSAIRDRAQQHASPDVRYFSQLVSPKLRPPIV